MTKLQTLAKIEGYDDPMDMLKDATFNAVAHGICSNKDCDYTVSVEPDCRKGWCEECQTQTVESCLIIAGMI